MKIGLVPHENIFMKEHEPTVSRKEQAPASILQCFERNTNATGPFVIFCVALKMKHVLSALFLTKLFLR
jgi:hypothetical protein